MIGINATIMDGAKIGANSIVAGNTIVTENSVFPENSIIAGVPGKVVATRDCGSANALNAEMYGRFAAAYAKGNDRLDEAEIAEIMALYGGKSADKK